MIDLVIPIVLNVAPAPAWFARLSTAGAVVTRAGRSFPWFSVSGGGMGPSLGLRPDNGSYRSGGGGWNGGAPDRRAS